MRSLIIRSIVTYEEVADEPNKLLLTYGAGVIKKKRTPHKIKPKPIKAKTEELFSKEKIRDKTPGTRRNMLILLEGMR